MSDTADPLARVMGHVWNYGTCLALAEQGGPIDYAARAEWYHGEIERVVGEVMAENARLRKMVANLCERVARQSDALSRIAERPLSTMDGGGDG